MTAWRWVGAILPALVLSIAATPRALGAQALEARGQSVPGPSIAAMRYSALALGPARADSPLAPERAAIRAAVRRSRWREGAVVGGVAGGLIGGQIRKGPASE